MALSAVKAAFNFQLSHQLQVAELSKFLHQAIQVEASFSWFVDFSNFFTFVLQTSL